MEDNVSSFPLGVSRCHFTSSTGEERSRGDRSPLIRLSGGLDKSRAHVSPVSWSRCRSLFTSLSCRRDIFQSGVLVAFDSLVLVSSPRICRSWAGPSLLTFSSRLYHPWAACTPILTCPCRFCYYRAWTLCWRVPVSLVVYNILLHLLWGNLLHL